MLPDVMKIRRELVARHMNIGDKDVLEIGAFDRPLFRPPEVRLAVYDFQDTESLVAAAKRMSGRDPGSVPPVDYVATSSLVSRDVDRTFDLVVCNHVVEHIPNLLEWLCDLRKVVRPDGRLLFSVPDRRYTFDYMRHETTLIDLLRAYAESKAKPSFWQILDQIYFFRPIMGVEGWHPEVLDQRLLAKDGTLLTDLARAEAQSRLPYRDTHCSVFTRASFVALFVEMKQAGIAPFKLDEVTDVQPGTNEFQAVLSPDEEFIGLPPAIEALRGAETTA